MFQFALGCFPYTGRTWEEKRARIFREFPKMTALNWSMETSFYIPEFVNANDDSMLTFFGFMNLFESLLHHVPYQAPLATLPVPQVPTKKPLDMVKDDFMDMIEQDYLDTSSKFDKYKLAISEADIRDALSSKKLVNEQSATVTYALLKLLHIRWISTLPPPAERTDEEEMLVARRTDQCKAIGDLYELRMRAYEKEMHRIESIREENKRIEALNDATVSRQSLKRARVDHMQKLWGRFMRDEPFHSFPRYDFQWTPQQADFIKRMISNPEFKNESPTLLLNDIPLYYLPELMSFEASARDPKNPLEEVYYHRYTDNKYSRLADKHAIAFDATSMNASARPQPTKEEFISKIQAIFPFFPGDPARYNAAKRIADSNDFAEIRNIASTSYLGLKIPPDVDAYLLHAIDAQVYNREIALHHKQVFINGVLQKKQDSIKKAYKVVQANMSYKAAIDNVINPAERINLTY